MRDVIEELKTRLRGATDVAPAPPMGFVPSIAGEDEEVATTSDFEEADIFGQSFAIEYRDALGELSKRRITVRALSWTQDDELCVKAFCWERKASRCFRADRIVSMHCLMTGEVIADPQKFFEMYKKPLKDVDFTSQLLKQIKPGLRALIFVARCDHEFVLEEREPMRWYAEQRATDRVFKWDIVCGFIERQRHDRYLAAKALRKIAKSPPDAKELLQAVAKVIDADGIIRDEETKVAIELADILENV
jgi:predicted DNA-binding transcriptional regulator YafY